MRRVSFVPLYDEYCLGVRYMSSVLQEAGHEVFINLAGRSIFGRWTDETKKDLRESRILTTENLV